MSTPFDTMPRPAAAPAATDFQPITDGQRAYLGDLMKQKAELKGLDAVESAAQAVTWMNGLSKAAASRRIDEAKAEIHQLKVQKGREQRSAHSGLPGADVVPAGRYAVETDEGATNELAFYKVDRPTEGRWAGYVFVRHLVGPDEQNVSFAVTKAVLAKIAAIGAKEASARYGHEIGHCGVCGLRLTNDESRARGIGPICAGKMGW